MAASTGISREGGWLVPGEEYPVFDTVVESKFLTSATRVVVIERETATQLFPAAPTPMTQAWFEEWRPFEGRLPPELVRDFLVKSQRPARLEDRFAFGATVRFVTADGVPEPETRWRPAPSVRPRIRGAQVTGGLSPILERLCLSRAAFDLRMTQALVYVAQERPDGTGAGILYWLRRDGGPWRVVEADVLWVVHPEGREEFDRG